MCLILCWLSVSASDGADHGPAYGDVAFGEVDLALATPEQSQAFVSGGPCIVESQTSINALGIQAVTRQVIFPTTPPLTTTTAP